jgi:UDP-N-acetylmuramate--alanine ligase
MRNIKHIHFIGIGGAGMGGIAEVLFNKGYKITGSDLSSSIMTAHLNKLGINIFFDHNETNIHDADVVVITSALSNDNVELVAAKAKGIPVVRRAEMLAELMRFGQGIAIAGTHGKTTTTSILASIIATAKLDPTFVIGGKLNSIGTNAKLGEGKYFIAEADESDASFLHLNPVIAVVTNIDRDHMPTYGGDFQNLRKVFIDFLLRLPFYGMAVINIDDPVARDIIPELRCQVVTYGCSANADYQLVFYKQNNGISIFKVYCKNSDEEFELTLNLPGKHNALNATAALAVCMEEGIELKYISEALAEFKGIGRRFQIYNNMQLSNGTNFTLIDDYGHHPREIAAILDALADGWSERRIVMVYQPHRYTRTRDLFDDFVKVLSRVNVLVLVPVYPASELPLPGATSEDLFKVINNNSDYNNSAYFYGSFDELLKGLSIVVQDDDIVVIQGAGNISQIATSLLSANNRV